MFVNGFIVWQERTEMHIFGSSPLHKSEFPCTFSIEFSRASLDIFTAVLPR